MTLQTRLSILVSFIVVAVSSSIGLFAVSQAFRQQLEFSDAKIEDVVSQISRTTEDPLSLASFLADQSDFLFSVSLITPNNEIVVIDDADGEISQLPSPSTIQTAIKKPVNLFDNRIRALMLEGGEFLVIGYSLIDIRDARNKSGLYLGVFTLAVLVIAISISILIFKRDSQLNKAARNLEESRSRMLEFLGDAAHELRTPLTVIRGYFELIRRGGIGQDKQKEYEMVIDREVERMTNLIDELLVASEVDSKAGSESARANLTLALENQLNQLRDLQPNRPIASRVQPDLYINFDEADLLRLLNNVFSNIRRYTPNDSRIECNTKRSNNAIVLEIIDSGPGLPEKFYQYGIRAFQRFDDARSRNTGGSGLGMSIMQKTVEKWGGEIHLSPGPSGGLRIDINFR